MPELIARPPDQPEEPSEVAKRPLRRLSFLASALVHALVVLAIILLWQPWPLEPEPAIEVKLVNDGPGAAGASGGAGGGGGQAPDATATPSTASAETTPPSEPTPSPSEEQETAPVAEAEPPPAPPAEETPPVPQHKPPRPRPHPAPAPAAKPAATPAAAPRQPVPDPRPPQIAAAPATVPTPGAPGAGSGLGGQNGGAGAGAEGRGRGAFGDHEGPGDDYLDRLRRWLGKYKHYPGDAQKAKQQGRLVVHFIIHRDGTVTAAAIERSSGFPLLDAAALQMLHDASPVPPLPDSYRASEAGVSLPVDFSLGLMERLF